MNNLRCLLTALAFVPLLIAVSCNRTVTPIETTETTSESILLHLTFDGENCTYEGPTDLMAVPARVVFTNASTIVSAMNFLRHQEGYSIQDAIDYYGTEHKGLNHPFWTEELGFWGPLPSDESVKVWKETWATSQNIAPGESGTVWEGDLTPGIYHLLCAKLHPFGVWFGAGLAVK